MRLMIKRRRVRPFVGKRKVTMLPKFIYYPERVVEQTIHTIMEHSGLSNIAVLPLPLILLKIPIILSFVYEIVKSIHERKMPHIPWILVVMIFVFAFLKNSGMDKDDD